MNEWIFFMLQDTESHAVLTFVCFFFNNIIFRLDISLISVWLISNCARMKKDGRESHIGLWTNVICRRTPVIYLYTTPAPNPIGAPSYIINNLIRSLTERAEIFFFFDCPPILKTGEKGAVISHILHFRRDKYWMFYLNLNSLLCLRFTIHISDNLRYNSY
jgi:hypothetical protein